MRTFTAILFLFIFSFGFSQWTQIEYTLIDSSCGDATSQEIFISEVYDKDGGSFGAVELYNPTNTTISLSDYSLRRTSTYGDNNWVAEWDVLSTVMQSHSIAPNSTFLIYLGTSSFECSETPDIYNADSFTGINGDDQIQLLKGSTVLDDVHAPSSIGYTLIRRPDANAPVSIYNTADWLISNNESCSDLGNHNIDISIPPEIEKIERRGECETPTAVRVHLAPGNSPYTFEFENIDTGYSYSGTNNNGIPSTPISGIEAGTYIFSVTDDHGCTVKVEFTLTDNRIETSPIILVNP